MPGARDGQLRIRRGTDSPPWALQLFDDDLGLWLTLAQADEEAEMVRAGIPILRGPYVVDYTDIPHNGDTLTLWTPQINDVLLRLFADQDTLVAWDHGVVSVGQNVDGVSLTNVLLTSNTYAETSQFDLLYDMSSGVQFNAVGAAISRSCVVFSNNNPMQLQFTTDDSEATQGHVELYALVARAVAP